MAAKIIPTPERVAAVCGYIETINLQAKDKATLFRVAPRFVMDDAGEYLMKPEYDEDGDLKTFEFYGDAMLAMALVTPQRLEKLIDEFSEAAGNIVNPPRGKA